MTMNTRIHSVDDAVRLRPRAGERASRWTLATDLDGTLLAGSAEQRERLAAALVGVRTIFVTGRAVESVRPLLSRPFVPTPEFIIADVGATVVDGRDFQPVSPLQERIDAVWPGARVVRERLAGFRGLVRQAVPQERRCSYTIEDPAVVTPELEEAVRELGCELLLSAGRYLDVLPRGVSKGSTLAALVDLLALDRDEVFVAGDTLNDLSLFRAGFAGVLVGNAEPAIVALTEDDPRVHLARSEGAGGILEALECRGLTAAAPQPAADPQQLVLLYHRLPGDARRSPNGIIPSLLRFFADGRSGAWIGWTIEQDNVDPAEQSTLARAFPGLTVSPIALCRSDVERFYQRFSKEALWPVLFSFPSRVEFSQEGWQHFVRINRLFAERAAREAEPGAMIWIHDYNLWMAPGILRALRPDLRLAFFHHTAFPSADVFNMLPWRREIVDSLLACDYVGFHVPRYVENFVDVVLSQRPARVTARGEVGPRFMSHGCALGVAAMTTELDVEGRRVGLGAHPVGVDVALICALVREPRIAARAAELRQQLGERTAVLSIERLDYVKGPLQKLRAFERLLERRPDLRGRVDFINVVTPPASGMTVHAQLGEQLDRAVGAINGRFGSMDWTPVRYFVRALPFEEVVAHYAACDVAWITPLRDGLNLVAKEFVAAQAAAGGDGVLILSEFAGAAVQLHGALLTNPYDETSMTDALVQALEMRPAERRERLGRLIQAVERDDVHRWGEAFIADAVRRHS